MDRISLLKEMVTEATLLMHEDTEESLAVHIRRHLGKVSAVVTNGNVQEWLFLYIDVFDDTDDEFMEKYEAFMEYVEERRELIKGL